MRKRGFTLLELIITTGLLSMVGGLSFMAISSSQTAMQVAKAKDGIHGDVRDSLTAMVQELSLASKTVDASLTPPLQDIAIRTSSQASARLEVEFQVPRDTTGRNWSNRIICRFADEDANENSRLDPGEDSNSDGLLTRTLTRLEDRNGDGDTNDAGERQLIGGATNISEFQAVRNGNTVTLTVTATQFVGARHDKPVSTSATSRVYLVN